MMHAHAHGIKIVKKLGHSVMRQLLLYTIDAIEA
jgi:hypothetical protein